MRAGWWMVVLLAAAAPLAAKTPAHDVIDVRAEHLDARFWIDRLAGDAQRVALTPAQIENVLRTVTPAAP